MSGLHANGIANCAPAGAQQGDDIVTQVLAAWHDERSRTHSEGCWQWHAPCAIAILGDLIQAQQAEIERLRTALEVAANRMSISGAAQATIDAIRKAVRGG